MDIFKLIWPNLPMITGVKMDLARSEDAGPIGLLSQKYIETGMPGWAWNPQRVTDAIGHPDSLVITARHQNEVIAAAIMQYRKKSAHLNLLVVAGNHQENGIGSCLLKFMENAAFLNNCSNLNLEVRTGSKSALAFYHAQGYRKTKTLTKYYHNGEDAVRMSRSINTHPSDRIIQSNFF